MRVDPGNRNCRRLVALALFALCGASVARAQYPRAAEGVPAVRYEIRAYLEGETKRLRGEETILWVNHSDDAVSELWFHLYLNAFSNNRTVHMTEAGGRLRGIEIKDGWGWQRVESVQVGGVELVETLRFRRPDEEETGDAEGSVDRTVFSIELEEPAPPGAEVEVRLTWDSQLPRVRRRTGYKDDFLFVAQWFPKLGVYENGRGWNCHQFHANTEFYANFGTFDVTLDLPSEYEDRVGGSGVRSRQSKLGNDRIEVQFQAPSEADRVYVDATGKLPLLHDFAWTADSDYHVEKGTFHFEDWAREYPEEVEKARRALPGRKIELRSVEVTALIQPERKGQAQRHIKATMAALFFYGLWFGEYPYEHITVVDPAWGGRAAGGMEYPTIFTAGSRLYTTEDMHTPENVTVHEAGHQFWYGLVGNNEFENAWLDEGFNSYTDSEVMWRVYGPRRRTTSYGGIPVNGVRASSLPAATGVLEILTANRWKGDISFFDFRLFKINMRPLRSSAFLDWWREQPALTLVPSSDDGRWGDRAGYLRDPETDQVEVRAWEYADRLSYRTNSYPRTAVALRTLSGLVGSETFLRGMRHYSENWRYDHPYPDDFFEAFIEGSGEDVSWYFEDMFRSTKTVDWSVQVSQRREAKTRGFFQEGNESFREHDPESESEPELESAESEGAVLAAGPASEGASETGDPDDPSEDQGGEKVEPEAKKQDWVANVLVRRRGELRLPIAVRLTYSDGSSEEVIWTREEQMEQTWTRIERRGDLKLRSVVLDPDRVYYVDRNMSDNQWFEKKDRVAPLRWAERVLSQYSHIINWQFGIGG